MGPDWRELRHPLCCPTCHTELADAPDGLACPACPSTYPASDGQIDLRLRESTSKTVRFDFDGEYEDPDEFDFAFRADPSPAVDWSGTDVPPHLDDALLSHFPKADSTDATALDAGCGDGIHREVCRQAGYHWVGVDYHAVKAPIRGDVHALPFEDGTFDFALSVAVLAHVANPFVALREIRRVLKPGSTFVGTVAFLEPFHRNTHYHHSPLGALHSLRDAGFTVEQLGPGWPSLLPIGQRLFPKLPRPLVSVGGRAVLAAHDAWYGLGRTVFGEDAGSRQFQRIALAGSFRFVATSE